MLLFLMSPFNAVNATNSIHFHCVGVEAEISEIKNLKSWKKKYFTNLKVENVLFFCFFGLDELTL